MCIQFRSLIRFPGETSKLKFPVTALAALFCNLCSKVKYLTAHFPQSLSSSQNEDELMLNRVC